MRPMPRLLLSVVIVTLGGNLTCAVAVDAANTPPVMPAMHDTRPQWE